VDVDTGKSLCKKKKKSTMIRQRKERELLALA